MSRINRSKLKSALKSFFAKRQGMGLESQVAILTLLMGAAWADGAHASEGAESGVLPVAKLSASEQKVLAEIKSLIQDGLTAEEIAQIIEATQNLEASQVVDVLEALLADDLQAVDNLDEMVEQLRAQIEDARGEAIALSPTAGKTKVASEKKAIDSEFGSDSPASGTSKVTVETPKEEDDDKGAVLLDSGDSLGLAPAFFAAGPLGPILGGVVGVAALAGGGGGGSSTPPLITQNGEAIDGYISGADVFVKAADGTLTKVGVTDELGQFEGLDGTPGLKLTAAQTALKLVVSGGIDISTGEPFAGSMEAPAGSLVVTPLTTILVKMMEEDPTLTIEQANDALVAKLGLAEGIDLTTLDPIQVASTMPPEGLSDEALAEFEANRLAALEVYQRGLAIITLAENASAVGAISFSDAFDSIVASISTNLVTEIDTVGLENVTSVTDTELVTVAVGGLADLNTDAFSGANLEAFIDAGKDVFGQIDLTVSVDDADSDRNEAVEGILGTFQSELLEGNEINDLIVGFGGDDTLLGGDGDDTLLGGLGNDSLIGGAGVDTIFGSEGDDTVAINLFTESAGQSDSIELGSGIDVVEVQGEGAFNLTFNTDEVGNNDVKDSEGNLAVTLSVQGLDELATRVDDEGLRFVGVDGGTFSVNDDGQFSEVVLGSAEADTLEATVEAGNVYIQGGEGNDLLTGASGNDILSGDAGDDDVIAGAGNDSVQGGDGNDNLQGDDGDDTLIGGAGDDSIQGGIGNDLAKVDVSVAGSDSIDLGDGNDVISITGADQVRITLDLSEVGNGSITNADSEFPVGIQAEDENGELTGDESVTVDETIRLVAEEGTKFDIRDSVTDEAYGNNFDQVILGSEGDDEILEFGAPGVESSNRFIAMGAGNDVVYTFTTGDDYISGGAGNDVLYDFVGNNTLSGGEGSDLIYALNNFEQQDSDSASFASLLLGGAGNDLLLSQGGNNTLDGGAGNDILYSFGVGDDVAIVDLADEGDDLINLGGGNNTVNVKGEGEFRLNLNPGSVGADPDAGVAGFNPNSFDVYLGLEDKSGELATAFTGGSLIGNGSNVDANISDTRVNDEGVRFVAVDGGTFDVRERSDSNPNEGAEIGNTFKVVSLGTVANDTLDESETEGDVYINGGAGSDSLVGGAGNDVLIGGREAAYLVPVGENVFTLLPDNDTFVGGLGDDHIIGNQGEDLASVDLTTDGNDTIELGIGDTIGNFGFSSGADTVSISGGSNVTITFDNTEVGDGSAFKEEDQLAVSLQADGSEFVVTTDDEAIRFESEGDETFTVKDDTVELGSGFDAVLLGGAGNDFINESESESTEKLFINGGEGNDFITSGAGDDLIFGGDGSDAITGGAGNDTIFGGADADSFSVNLSTDGSDSVDLGTGFDSVSISGSANTRITLDLAAVGNDDIHSSGDTLAVSVQSQDTPDGDILHIDDEGLRFSAQEMQGSVLVDAKFEVRDLEGNEVSPGDLFDEVVLGTSELDSISDYSSKVMSEFFNQQVAEATETPFVPSGSPDVFVEGGQGDDLLFMAYGDDYISGGEGNDVLFGSAGNDTFIAGAGDDKIGTSDRVIELNDELESFYNVNNSNPFFSFTSNLEANDDESGDDVLRVNLEADGNDTVNLGSGLDSVELRSTASQVRVTFDDTAVGFGSVNNVQVQAENSLGNLADGNLLITDDEGIRFEAAEGTVFDAQTQGASLGDNFSVVSLGSVGNDTLDESETAGEVYIHGGVGSDSLVGGDGNDLLVGGREGGYFVPNPTPDNSPFTDDEFFELADNDTFVGGLGDDLIIGNNGADVARVNLSTDGNDTLQLGNGETSDSPFATNSTFDTVSVSGDKNVTLTFNNAEVGDGDIYNADNELAVSLQADDSLFVSTADDEAIRFVSEDKQTFTVKDGTEELGSGFDVVALGSAGNDFMIESSSTNNFINGGQGNDYIVSGSGDDVIFSGADRDVVIAGGGADLVYGGEGSDYILGEAGNDTIYGGNGSDYLIGGTGNDNIYGGDDADSFDVNLSTDGSDTVDLGSGFDFVRVFGSADTRMTLDVSAVGNDDIERSADTLAVSVQSQDTPDGDILHIDDEGLRFVAQDYFEGTTLVDAKFDVRDLEGDQVSAGNLFDEVVLGTAGADYVDDYRNKAISEFYREMAAEEAEQPFVPSGSPDVFVEGGQGDDFLTTAYGNDYLSGGEGNDAMFGSAGNDTFIAGAGDDKIGISQRVIDANNSIESFYSVSNPNNNIFKFTSNLQANDDESGDDLLIVNLETDGNDTVNLGSGADTVELTSTASTVRMTFDENLVGNGGANDVFVQASADNKAGVSGNILTTDDEGMRFEADDGTLFSLEVSGSSLGDDFSVVDLGSVGDDLFNEPRSTGRVYINGGAGNDSIVGGSGNDVVFGGAGADLFRVDLDNDGSDVANLGSELDTVEVSSSAPQVRVSFDTAGVGQGDRNSVTAQAEDGGGDLIGSILTTDDEGIRFVAQDASLFEITTSNGTSLGDDFGVVGLGSLGGDVFDESEAESRVYLSGGQGEDILIGGSAEDILLGGAGNDVLAGGAGNDFIDGGEGNDDIAQFTEEGRELASDDVFAFNAETNTLTFTDNFGSSLEVDTLIGVEKLDFGQFTGNNQVFVTEAQLAVLKEAGVGFADNNDVTLIVDGSTLSESNLTLSDLQNLGIDHVLTDGPLVNIELGSGPEGAFLARVTNAGGDIDSRLDIDFKVNSDSVEKDTAVVNLGLTSDQLEELFVPAPGGIVADNLNTIAGKDQFALIDGGNVNITEREAAALYGSDATVSKLSISDHFATADGVGTQTSLTLDVSGSTISDNDLSLVDLARLGVDEISLGDTMTDTGFFVNIGIGEAIEQFATAYLADNAEDFSGALSDAVAKSVSLAASINNIEFSGGDFISEFIFADALSEDAAAAIKGLAATSDPAFAEFNNFEAALRGSLESNLVNDINVTPGFVSVLVADATADGTVLADSELSAADLDDLGFDLLLLGDRDQSDNIVGYADLEALLADLGEFNLDTLTDNAGDGTDVDQDSIALVNIDLDSFEPGSFELADLQALAALGLDAIAIGNSFDDFIANGDLDINDLINSHPDNLP